MSDQPQNVQFIHQDGSPAFAIIPYDQYLALTAENEDAEDRQAVLAHQHQGGEMFPADLVEALLDPAQSPVALWRAHRGFTASQLAAQVGISAAYLSEIENGKKSPSVRVLKALAECLRVDLEDLC